MENNSNPENQQKKLHIIIKVLIVISLIVLIAYALYEYFDDYYYEYLDLKESVANYKQMIVDKNKKITEYNKKLENYEKQIEFMDNHVAICPLDGSGLYHKYGCEHLDASSFMIYNTEQAPNEGYFPCFYCSELDNTTDIKTEIVYVTDTGSKYHRSGCSYLKSKNSITKENAIQQGYSACSRCNP